MTDRNNDFLPQRGDFRRLRAFQVTTVIYDMTRWFATNCFLPSDRTIDQMVQAARSGRQNIAEGSAAGATSKETEIKLTNVAKASLQELLLDYEDFLRQNELHVWDKDHPKAVQTRAFCRTHNESSDYMPRIRRRSPETVANIAIILIHQADVLLERLIERQKADFLAHGGMREEMTRARLEARKNNGMR